MRQKLKEIRGMAYDLRHGIFKNEETVNALIDGIIYRADDLLSDAVETRLAHGGIIVHGQPNERCVAVPINIDQAQNMGAIPANHKFMGIDPYNNCMWVEPIEALKNE